MVFFTKYCNIYVLLLKCFRLIIVSDLPNKSKSYDRRYSYCHLQMSPVANEISYSSQRHPAAGPEQFECRSSKGSMFSWKQLTCHYYSCQTSPLNEKCLCMNTCITRSMLHGDVGIVVYCLNDYLNHMCY